MWQGPSKRCWTVGFRASPSGVSSCTYLVEPDPAQSLHTKACRPVVASKFHRKPTVQIRWITQNYIRKMKEAEEQWARFAQEIKEGKRKSFVQLLEERGLLHQVVGERDMLHELFTKKRAGLYAGIDPTAPSLHIGHMLPLMVLAWGFVSGLPVTFLLGGSTGRIGDPTGRLKGRELVHSSVRKANIANMHMQLKRLGASIEAYGVKHGYQRALMFKRALTNNNIWWNKTPFLEVLRDLGGHIRLGPMLGRDTVKSRLTSGDGMSFAEFSYPILQSWDWWVLFQKGTQVQVGGADQFGNILFGMDVVKTISKNTAIELKRKPLDDDLDKPMGLTTPLLTTSAGEKFGKSAGNAIWLDQDMTPIFDLYQFFIRTADADVERYLKMFTFLPLPKIAEIMTEQNKNPSKRVAQHTLAGEFVELVHGPQEAQAVALQHLQLFRPRSSSAEPTPPPTTPQIPANYARSPAAKYWNPQAGNKYASQTNFANMGAPHLVLPKSLVYNQPFHRILYSAGMVSSKSEGHRILSKAGAYVGSRPGDTGQMSDALAFTPIHVWPADKTQQYILDGNVLILKLGKWKMKIINIISDDEYRERGLSAPGWEELEESKAGCDEKYIQAKEH